MSEIEPRYESKFISEAKLSFQTFKDIVLNKKDLTELNLMSSVIFSGFFRDVCLYNSSFLSTKFLKTNFENCNFKNADICSIWIKESFFYNCDFGCATISDSTFINCTFKLCSFLNVSLTNCQFLNCIFEQMPIDDSTVCLNMFSECKIHNTQFTESFYYQIFDNCSFDDVAISSDLLGYNFGFSKEFLWQLAEHTDLGNIEKEFLNKGLFVNAAVFRINLVKNYYDKAIITCITAIDKMIENDIIIKSDEIQFLKNLTIHFERMNFLAPISIIRIWSRLNRIISTNTDNTALEKALPYIREYANMLYFNFQHFLEDLQEKINYLPQNDNSQSIELKVVYNEQPDIPLLDMLTEMSIICGSNCIKPELIRVEKGSFIEFHKIALEIIPYIQTFFSVLGFFTPIAIHYDQIKKEKKQKNENIRTPEKELEITLSNSAKQPCILIPNTNIINATTNDMVSSTIRILEKHSIEDRSGFSGYNSQNIKSITIRFQ